VPAQLAATPDPAALTETYAAAQPSSPPARIGNSESVFHSLFRTGARRGALAGVVSALWSAPPGPADAKSSATAGEKARAKRATTHELFQDQETDASALFRGRV
jgi:hypothetical protein